MSRFFMRVALTAVVGSVGRYREFNRQFLPLSDSLKERWVQVNTLSTAFPGKCAVYSAVPNCRRWQRN